MQCDSVELWCDIDELELLKSASKAKKPLYPTNVPNVPFLMAVNIQIV